MDEQQIKNNIQSALKGFSTHNLTDQSISLFKTLGYNTKRQNRFTQKNYQEFKDNFGDFFEGKKFNEEKALTGHWKYIDLLFQLTKDEVSIQESLFNTQKVKWEGEDKETVIETYLFFVLELLYDDYSRGTLAQITREINKIFPMPAMLLFKCGKHLTLSIINRRLSKKDSQKDVLEKVTLIKDISIASPHRAHIEILFDLSFAELKRKYSLTNFVELHNAWQSTLDIKELNKRFYRELSNWYFWAIQKVSFPNDINDDTDATAYNSESVIRLITRLIFIWFIKEKRLVPEKIFDAKELIKLIKDFGTPDSTVYYRAILQNLFFATLNQKIEDRAFANDGGFPKHREDYGIKTLYRYADDFLISKKEVIELFKHVPFLNGGLFDCLDQINHDGKVMYFDGFSRNPKKQAQVPDELFFTAEKSIDLSDIYADQRKKSEKVKGLFNIFNNYKFTVAENTPIEEEVALDPELLGRVFENLLASYNPETQTTARKQTGSFYTPREIVNYMVDESLKTYLKQKLETEANMKPEDAEYGLEVLFGYNERDHLFNENETQILVKAIDNCKIIDPACGSGAFPMGILHKLVFVLQKLDPENKIWQKVQTEKIIKEAESIFELANKQEREERLIDINNTFDENISNPDYARKLFIIENCIYGVDIQPIATQISKLRFFISLVVDQKADINKDNLGIRPLPNLELKFVSANTLIGIDKPKKGEFAGNIFDNNEVKRLEKKLQEVRHKSFSARTATAKQRIRQKDRELRDEMSKILESSGWSNKSARQLAQWDPYDQNASSPFFDTEWMFGIKDGFDIVIGNPPYLESRHPSFLPNLKTLYQKNCELRWGQESEFIKSGADLLVYFFELSISIIKDEGNVLLITQNAWLDTEYGRSLQKFLVKQTNVLSILDSKYRYFPSGEGPNINTVIVHFFGKKPCSENKIGFYILKRNINEVNLKKISSKNTDNDYYKVNYFSYKDIFLKKYKWGVLHNSDSFILDLLENLEKKAKTIDKIPSNAIFKFGQGLNLKKSNFIPINILNKYKIQTISCYPILYSGAPFRLCSSDWYIVRKNLIDKDTKDRLEKDGYDVFDEKSTTKNPPILILPRGISRHFCCLNRASAYSLSGVDVYCSSNLNIEEEVLSLWCFFNSSLFWLLREISGRKNLGGGLLKSEATDLKEYPIYMPLEIKKEDFKSLFEREAMDTLDEIFHKEHQKIDKIVFDYLNIRSEDRERCIKYLYDAITLRASRSKT
jgi:adenine-specific DNA-methyltransferase